MKEVSAYLKKRMADAKITLVNEQKLLLKCNVDGQSWQAQIKPGGRLGNGWWKCPNGCSDK